MKAVLLFTFGLFIFPNVNGQNIPTIKDSLLSFIDTYQERNTIRVNALIDLQEFLLVDDHTQGRAFIEEAIEISKEIDFQQGLASAYNSLGGYYIRQGELDSALVNTLAAIKILENVDETDRIIAAYNNLAIIYGQTEEIEKAVTSYLEIVELLKKKPVTNTNVVVYYNLALAYQLLDNNEKFEVWMRKVIETSSSLNFTFGIVRGNLQLAAFEYINENYRETITITDEVLNVIRKAGGGIQQAEARAYSLKADALERLGNPDEAILNKQKSIQLYKEINSTQSVLFDQERLSDMYRNKGDYKNALESVLAAQSLRDSIFTAEQQVVVEELQTKYETEKIQREKETTELENLMLQNENRRAQLLLFSSIGFLILLGIGGAVYTRNQQLKKKAELADLELQETQKRLAVEQQKRVAELKAVRSQLNPHFIFNLLNSIQEMNISGDQDKANQALSKVSSIMRKTLSHSEKDTISLRDELELVELYLEAEKLRFEDKLNYSIDVDDDVEDEFIRISPMFIQPYVENSVKHGLLHKKESGTIKISITTKNDDMLSIEIEDDGIGREKASKMHIDAKKHNKYATKANEERIANIAKETNTNAKIEYADLANDSGTKVIITYPII